MKRRTLITAVGAGTLAQLSLAQFYPARPIKYICPWPAGGSTDVVMRSLAESASKALGQQVVVENKPGAGGMLGAVEMLNARPDGYTLCQIPQGAFRIPHMQKVSYDTLRDFTWIACLTGSREDFEAITNPIYNYFNDARQRVGLADLYFTDQPDAARMHSRPVIGGRGTRRHNTEQREETENQ